MESEIDRRRLLKAASAAGLAGIAGCSGGPSGDGSDDEDDSDGSDGGGGDGSDGSDGDGADGADDVPARVGIVYSDGGLGDNSFNDAAQQGLLQAEEEFGIEYNEAEPD
ncbi:twin-arginine translocation signal domain-containing protein, partial [Halorubrum sp. SD626R]|uniref:twin-arginine translocation signal domain-containing protein n=1 Tax=Halorubrum sp. SD626R TaxID=1419722 RepID=UPI0010FA2027